MTVEGNLELFKTISGFEGEVGLVRALINEPKLLLFDEVTIGFDSEGLEVITGVLGDLAEREQRSQLNPRPRRGRAPSNPGLLLPTAIQHP